MLDDSLDIYATTASNAYESSWGTYCPGMAPPPPPEFTTCLGDLYSVAWLENRRAAADPALTLTLRHPELPPAWATCTRLPAWRTGAHRR